jgi:hypothetical protein
VRERQWLYGGPNWTTREPTASTTPQAATGLNGDRGRPLYWTEPLRVPPLVPVEVTSCVG